MTNLRGLDFSGNKATLVQRLMEDDNRREHGDSNMIKGKAQQEESEDLLTKNDCPICWDKTEEDNRMYLFKCCKKWTCITCSIKWITEPRCMLCNIDKTEDRLARATVTLLD